MDSITVLKSSNDEQVKKCFDCKNCQENIKTIVGIMHSFYKGYFTFWFLRIPGDEFQEFVNLVEPISEEFSLLPFWCLCDRQGTHRLSIVAFKPDGSFPRVWGNRPKMLIKTGRQLQQLIQYMGQTKCFCIPPGEESIDTKPTDNHFYVNKPVLEPVLITAMLSIGLAFPSMGFEEMRNDFEDKDNFWVSEDGWKIRK